MSHNQLTPAQLQAVAKIEIVEFREFQKGESLVGFVTFQLPSGLVLHDCTYHKRGNGARWIGMPARSYTAKDGSSSWQRLVDFASREAHERFQKAALEALDAYFALVEAAKKTAVL